MTGSKLIFESEEEDEWQFRGTEIVRTQKSMSVAITKAPKDKKSTKSNSFLHPLSKNGGKRLHTAKKFLDPEDVKNKPSLHSRSSKNKTSITSAVVSKNSVKQKKKSLSRDFLMLNNRIYECDNIEEVNQKMICRDAPISHQRFCTLTMKKISALQKYLRSFCRFAQYHRQDTHCPFTATRKDKLRLYALLKTTCKWEELGQEGNKIDELMKLTVEKVERDSAEMMHLIPQCIDDIKQWRTQKLHQILQANTLLRDEEECLEGLESRERISDDGSVHQPDNSQRSFIQKRQAYNIEQKYPKRRPDCTLSIPDQNTHSDITDLFMGRMWEFLVSADLVDGLITSLRRPYGLSPQEKCRLRVEGLPNCPFRFYAGPTFLNNQVFIQFCRQNHFQLPVGERTEWSVLEEKAMFDCLNETLCEYQPDFPAGASHPLEGTSSLSAFLIDEQNILDVWEDVMKKVLLVTSTPGPAANHEAEGVPLEDSFENLIRRQVLQHVSETILEQLTQELLNSSLRNC